VCLLLLTSILVPNSEILAMALRHCASNAKGKVQAALDNDAKRIFQAQVT